MEQTTSQTTDQIIAESDKDRNLAVIGHAGGILFGFLPPLIIWILNKDDKSARYITIQAKEALNFQITVAFAFFICLVLVFVLIGALLIWFVWLADIICCLLGAVKASKGENYRYPLTIRLIK